MLNHALCLASISIDTAEIWPSDVGMLRVPELCSSGRGGAAARGALKTSVARTGHFAPTDPSKGRLSCPKTL